jgi:hypothetical protein
VRLLLSVRHLVARIRVAPSPVEAAPVAKGRPKGRLAPAPKPRPTLTPHAPQLMQIERGILERFRGQMCEAIQEQLDLLAANEGNGSKPMCCGRPMSYHDRRGVACLSWMGLVRINFRRYRCLMCKRECRPLLEQLGVEPGQPSGLLARLLSVLGCVVPYALTAELTWQILGVKVNAMTVWRAVQRLGEAAARHSEALSAYHADSGTEASPPTGAPDAVVVAVDGCTLGMQVRAKRRRRKTPDEVLPALPVMEEGHFREVKTGVLLLPTDRVQQSPERRTLVRRVVVTCLGDANALFNRLWAELSERGWYGLNTTVAVVGDGAEWIWNRAALFPRRCEILDFWHALEYAWAYARLQFGEGSRNAERWVRRVADDLKAGKVLEVIARLKSLHPNSQQSLEALRALRKYYTDNASRMRYDEYLRLGYGIGSGAVESAHKQVVHARLRQAGMRWSEQGARRLLAMRLLLLNGDWAMTERLRMVRFAG